ncbi:MAG: ABC1 kinase family protein, partial [Cellulomonadaceae bacterium]
TSWIKLGQTLSMRPDLVGAQIAADLRQLQSGVAPDPDGAALRTVESELGHSVKDLFGSFQRTAMASGSIAEVHKATLPDRTRAVVKVVHAGAPETARADLAIMGALAAQLEADDPEIARLRPTRLLEEFATMLTGAFDLRSEAENLRRFRASFADQPDVAIPEPFADLTARRVLTMTRLEGRTLTDRASIERAGWEPNDLAHRVAEIYLQMIFRDGVFHADPHPGNFLLPGNRTVAILDFGDVGRLTPTRRDQLERLVIAIGTRDVEAVIDAVVDVSAPPPGTDLERLRADLEDWMDRSVFVQVDRMDVATIIESGMAVMHRHRLTLPTDLMLLFRVVLGLQGLATAVGVDLDVTQMLAPYVRDMMRHRFSPRRIAREGAHTGRRWARLAQTLPDDLSAALTELRKGEVSINFKLEDPDHLTDRLVDGGIAAASILASAQLVSRRTPPTVAGVSVPGLVGVGVGVATWMRLAASRRERPSVLGLARRLTGR